MFNRVVALDVLNAITWSICRIAPLCVYVSMMWAMGNQGAHITPYLMITLMYGAVAWLIALATNTVPVLFVRYQSRHQIRDVVLNDKRYNQIRLFGTWMYISIDVAGGMTLSKYLSASYLTFCYQSEFKERFAEFINAHRNIIDPISSNSFNHTTFIRGEQSKYK